MDTEQQIQTYFDQIKNAVFIHHLLPISMSVIYILSFQYICFCYLNRINFKLVTLKDMKILHTWKTNRIIKNVLFCKIVAFREKINSNFKERRLIISFIPTKFVYTVFTRFFVAVIYISYLINKTLPIGYVNNQHQLYKINITVGDLLIKHL